MNEFFINPEYHLLFYSNGNMCENFLSNTLNESDLSENTLFENITASEELFAYFFSREKVNQK